uniref:uncharacterized protein LOC128929019 n=1 Tax=Callithrix jacchus TaxID=9483 RepID=UPI0023DD4709|nr:uncharacterized protein LOC128929019 [Callithrix jacchus]
MGPFSASAVRTEEAMAAKGQGRGEAGPGRSWWPWTPVPCPGGGRPELCQPGKPGQHLEAEGGPGRSGKDVSVSTESSRVSVHGSYSPRGWGRSLRSRHSSSRFWGVEGGGCQRGNAEGCWGEAHVPGAAVPAVALPSWTPCLRPPRLPFFPGTGLGLALPLAPGYLGPCGPLGVGTITASRAHAQPLLPEHTRGSQRPDGSTVSSMAFRDGEGSPSSAGALQQSRLPVCSHPHPRGPRPSPSPRPPRARLPTRGPGRELVSSDGAVWGWPGSLHVTDIPTETPARPAEHYSKVKESQRKRQLGGPVNSLISNVNQIQAHDIR